MTIDPGSSGWAGWKEALWTLNYLQVMHDSNENPVTTVPDDQLALVGTPGNTVLGSGRTRAPHCRGHVPRVERHRGLPGRQLPRRSSTTRRSSGCRSSRRPTARRSAASPASRTRSSTPTRAPLRWFPGVDRGHRDDRRERLPAADRATRSPSPDSHLLDLAGLLGAYSSIYALTDQSNTQVGGSQPALAYFDGDPFPVQNQADRRADAARPRARDGARRSS